MAVQLSGYWWYRLLICSLLVSYALLSATSVCRKSSTYDETAYVGAGAYVLHTHSLDDEVALRHPIFWTVLHDLPLLVMTKIPDEIWQEKSGILRGQKILALRKDDLLLNACRFMLLPFAIGLGVVIFRWSRQLHGDFGALVSVVLYCFCPNFLGHGSLVTPDVMLSCSTAFTAWRLWVLAKTPRTRNLMTAGLGVGWMLLSKYTSLLLMVALFTADIAYRTATRQMNWKLWKNVSVPFGHLPILLIIGLAIVWIGYGFDVSWVALPSGGRILLPAGPYFHGAIYQYSESRQPHSLFLMGMLSNSGWWYYFIVVCLIKVPTGVIVLTFGLLVGRRLLGTRFSADDFYLVLPFALLFVYLSCFNTIQNGFRYLLPTYALLFVLLGKYGDVMRRCRTARLVVGFFVLWAISSSILAWPNYIAYCNELIGGTRQGYHWLGDSNIDWGQDLKELGRFMNNHRIGRIQLSYFGTADPDHYRIDYEYLPSADSPLPRTFPLAEGDQPSRFLAISAYHYQGIGFFEGNPDENVYRALYKYVPNYVIGGSILIFDTQDLHTRIQAPLSFKVRQLVGLAPRDASLDCCP